MWRAEVRRNDSKDFSTTADERRRLDRLDAGFEEDANRTPARKNLASCDVFDYDPFGALHRRPACRRVIRTDARKELQKRFVEAVLHGNFQRLRFEVEQLNVSFLSASNRDAGFENGPQTLLKSHLG